MILRGGRRTRSSAERSILILNAAFLTSRCGFTTLLYPGSPPPANYLTKQTQTEPLQYGASCGDLLKECKRVMQDMFSCYRCGRKSWAGRIERDRRVDRER